MRRRYFITSVLNLIGVIIGFLTSLYITPFALGILGKEAYGVWVLATTFSAAAGYLSILDFGFQSSVVLLVAEYATHKDTAKVNQVFSMSLYLFLGIGLIGAAALALFAAQFLTRVFNIPPDLVGTMRLLLYLLALQNLIEFPGLIFGAMLEGIQRYDLHRAIKIGQVLVYAILMVVLLSQGYGLFALGVTALVRAIIQTVITAILAWRLVPGLRLVRGFDGSVLRRLWHFSGQIFLIRMSAVIYNTMDRTLIGGLLTSTMLTDYDIAAACVGWQ